MDRTVHGVPEGVATLTTAEAVRVATEEQITGALGVVVGNVVTTEVATGVSEKKDSQEESICPRPKAVAEVEEAVEATPTTTRTGSKT